MPHSQYRNFIDAANACATACDHCAVSCLAEREVQHLARCIQLDVDCAEICRLAASYMSRGSELAAVVTQACAEVCNACAEECEQHAAMEHCKDCAQACRRCAELCRRMAQEHPRAAPGAGAGTRAHH